MLRVIIAAGIALLIAGISAVVSHFVTKASVKEKPPVLYEASFSTERMWYDEDGGITAICFESKDGAKHCVTINKDTVIISPVYEIDGSIQIKKEMEE